MNAAFDAPALLAEHPVFQGLARETLTRICAESTEIHLDDQEVLYVSGERADRVFVLLKGALQIEYPLAGTTRGKVTAVLLAPGFLGECQVLNDRAWSGTGVSVTELIALSIRTTRFLALIETIPVLTQNLYYELTARFLYAIETWRHEPTHKPEVQIARYLLARQEVLRSWGRPSEVLTVKQVDLARAAGLRAETVNRILSRWAKAGWVKKVEAGLGLLDPGALAAITQATPTPALIQHCRVPGPGRSDPTGPDQ